MTNYIAVACIIIISLLSLCIIVYVFDKSCTVYGGLQNEICIDNYIFLIYIYKCIYIYILIVALYEESDIFIKENTSEYIKLRDFKKPKENKYFKNIVLIFNVAELF